MRGAQDGRHGDVPVYCNAHAVEAGAQIGTGPGYFYECPHCHSDGSPHGNFRQRRPGAVSVEPNDALLSAVPLQADLGLVRSLDRVQMLRSGETTRSDIVCIVAERAFDRRIEIGIARDEARPYVADEVAE